METMARSGICHPHHHPDPRPEPRAGRCVLFQVAGHCLALDLTVTREIVPFRSLTRIPKAPAAIPGAIHLRGQILPVLCMRLLMGYPPGTQSRAMRIVVAECGGQILGLLVDRVLGVVPGPEETALQPPDAQTPAFVRGTWMPETGEPTWLIDPDRLLAAIPLDPEPSPGDAKP